MTNNRHNGIDEYWQVFLQQEGLTQAQGDQFDVYAQLLVDWNTRMNLTAITDRRAIIDDHFCDSLAIGRFFNMSTVHTVADVGTGAGFPGIPLAIKYPHVQVVLIEVNEKKISFLQTIITILGLTDRVEIVPYDWRAFLRNLRKPIDIFLARASLKPAELIRLFSPSSMYKDALLIYWASITWQPHEKEKVFLARQHAYRCGSKSRKLVLFQYSLPEQKADEQKNSVG